MEPEPNTAPAEATPAPAAPAEATPAPATPAPATPAPAAPPSRRRFLRWLGGLTVVSTAVMILAPVAAFLIPSKNGAAAGGGKVPAGTTADIPPGTGKVVAMGAKPVIVVNTDQGVKAYSAICPHLGCVVVWNDLIGAIQCPCHDGRFNPDTGGVVSGPPPSGLPPITVSVEGDEIFLAEA